MTGFEESRALIIAICVLAYFVLCVFVGLWAMSKTKSAGDFFMAGRNLGAIVTSVAVFSSVMSGFGFVGGPGLVYEMGGKLVLDRHFGGIRTFNVLLPAW